MKEPIEIFRFGTGDAEKLITSTIEPHYHNYEEILIGIEGQIEHFIDFESKTIKSPFVSFITKGKVHRLIPKLKNNKCDLWVIRFQSEFIADTIFQFYTLFHNNANVDLPIVSCYNRLDALCNMIYEENSRTTPNYTILQHLLNTILVIIEAEINQDSQLKASNNHNDSFLQFLKLLEKNYKKPLSVEFYAKKLFMSSRNLNLICQEILHKSVSEIIENRKLMEAKNLLTGSTKTISEIGFELGYTEKAYFSRVFKKKAGISPSAFRNEMKQLLS